MLPKCDTFAQYLPPVFLTISAPDDHFTARPHCRVNFSAKGRVDRAGIFPIIGDRIVSAASVNTGHLKNSPAPDNHLTAGPDCRVARPGIRRIGGAGGCPTVGRRIVSPAGVRVMPASGDVQHIRPRRSFQRQSTLPCERIGQRARWWCWSLSNCRCRDCISRQYSKS